MREVRYRYSTYGEKYIEHYECKFIKEEKWHDPPRMTKFLRIINRTILILTTLLLNIYIWDEYMSGQSVILSLFITLNPFFLIAGVSSLSEISTNIVGKSEDSLLIKVEEGVYKEYLNHVKDSRWIPSILLVFLFFVCLLAIGVSLRKFEFAEFQHFWITHGENCLFAALAIFGIIMTFINALFFKTLHLRLDNKLWRKIYNQ